MGRYRILPDDHHGDGNDHNWEFVAEPGNEGAIALRTPVSAAAAAEEPSSAATELPADHQHHHAAQVFSVWHAPQGTIFPYDDDQPPRRRRFYWSFWIISSWIVIVLAWCLHEGPPAPPPPTQTDSMDDDNIHHSTTTWRDYLSTHTTQLIESLTALTFHTPVHLGSWWLSNRVVDVQVLYEQWWSKKRGPATACSLQIPTEDNDNDGMDIMTILTESVVGQQRAATVLLDAVHAWKQESPLFIYLTGHANVGKRTMALTLARRVLFRHCGDDDNNNNDPVLVLSGKDYVSDHQVLLEESLRMRLAQTILRHVQRFDGAVIILRDLEQMSPHIFAWLSRELSSSSTSSLLQLREHCRKVVFCFTSSVVGTTSITRSLRNYGNIDHAGLISDIAYEINEHFHDIDSSFFHAIAPFVPLTPENLSTILRQKVALYSNTRVGQVWKKLTITDAATAALLNDKHVEYLEWKRRDEMTGQSELFMKVAMEGAKVLDESSSPVLTKIYAQVNRCLATNPRSSQVAVLDYYHDDNGHSGIMKWCRDDETTTLHCREACRFAI